MVADFMGYVINSFQEPPASVCSVWTTVFTREFSECFQKLLFFFGSNLSVSQNYCVFSEMHWFLPTLREF